MKPFYKRKRVHLLLNGNVAHYFIGYGIEKFDFHIPLRYRYLKDSIFLLKFPSCRLEEKIAACWA